MAAPFAVAQTPLPGAAQGADIVFLGEQHDNPDHHARQAEWVAALAPKALVFEMLTTDQAARATDDARQTQGTLQAALGWDAAGWPDFAMYYPIFTAAPEAAIYGAGVPRDDIRGVMEHDVTAIFGAADAARFGLDAPLPLAQQTARQALQAQAHCDALPQMLLPMMVSVQRLRDASLARAALAAFAETGGPVVVITGNGHARTDWGAPVYLRHADPALDVIAIGQGEAGQDPAGAFDGTVDGAAVDRGDPCDAFN
ncbi:ChaN family lipoprotein [Roseobacter sp.]|uniref:ChaN family lipoprotein n=1 Tax=Roseobacter sp. TaxID=1907202 RepID=UPI00329817C1